MILGLTILTFGLISFYMTFFHKVNNMKKLDKDEKLINISANVQGIVCTIGGIVLGIYLIKSF